MTKPDYLFEVSWEVCNKIGGIHTVISTKALSVLNELNDNYITIGPDVWRESDEHPEFEDDLNLFSDWKENAARQGIRVRTGRWKIAGRPIAVLIDFTSFFARKDEVFKSMWESYKLDSISGQWDYIEPTLFGYAAGKTIESFTRFYDLIDLNVAAHFHEWQTGAGLLYLELMLPKIGTVFTTHATVVGRAIAGNNQPLYSKMESYSGDVKAREFNVISKQSLEKIAANNADAFTTVSELTATECQQFDGKPVDVITPNGFEDSFVPDKQVFASKRGAARKKLLEVASALTGDKLGDNTLLIATSGRYEFRNKGIDLMIDALGELNREPSCNANAVAFILIPANHYGPRKDLQEKLQNSNATINGKRFLTHNLHYEDHDLILNRIEQNGMGNNTSDRIKIIFVPSYLNGSDGIFNISYYDLLIGFDITLFPSYYEPWGYTPLESLAFSIPTVTTTLTGFGLWVNREFKNPGNGITVISRDDFNDHEVELEVGKVIKNFCKLSDEDREKARKSAFEISRIALWKNLIEHYWQTYDVAIGKASGKEIKYFEKERIEKLPETQQVLIDIQPIWRRVLVQQSIPDTLKPLETLSKNLWWSWNQNAIELFESIDFDLWKEVGENPIVMLDRLPYEMIRKLEKNQEFLTRLNEVYSEFNAYMDQKPDVNKPSIAYFSMEFGLINSLKIYSGGLGLLAGDYLKEASDYNYKMVGVGLLYRFGYFSQVISAGGEQVAISDAQDFSKLPVTPVRGEDGNWKSVQIVFPGRTVHARIWKVQVGRVPLYLLDTDYEANNEDDRGITHNLYGGDNENRLKQELLLGIGGIRAIREIGVDTDLYHCNEGHAAFTGLERLREYIQDLNMTFPEALEIVRGSSLFTTHTPVPAGHDYFEEDVMRAYIAHYPERLKIDWTQMMNLGRFNPGNAHEKFSMSVLAVNLSQEVNGVSRLHGQVSKEMFTYLWRGYMTDELHIGYVTNGVHLPTWLARSWDTLYSKTFGKDFLRRQEDRVMWDKIMEVPSEEIWKIKSAEREKLITYIKNRLSIASAGMHDNPKQIIEIATALDKDALTIGFARRFATYKRAHLLFRDMERLAKIVNNEEMPVQFVFAGKAHPKDIPGQDLIKMIVNISKRPEFVGKVIFIENYDILLAKRLVQGVDIWLNTPTRPLEASGTSGEKAVMNGTMHFSVLDGWWAEGYREDGGWALPLERSFDNQDLQDELDAERIYSLLENDIIPKFYNRDQKGVPERWVQKIKNSIAHIAPEFTMNRMLRDYDKRFYSKLHHRTQELRKDDFKLPKELSHWKNKLLTHWKNVKVIEYDFPNVEREQFTVGQAYTGKVVLDLDGLRPEEVGVEMVMAETGSSGPNHSRILEKLDFICTSSKGSVAEYTFLQEVEVTGQFDIGFRIYPKNDHIPHRMDFPLVRWI